MAREDKDPALSNLPPQDLSAEQAVLGACLLEPERTVRAAHVRPGDFYKTAHRMLFEAMQRLVARGEQVDAITVAAELHGAKEFDAYGGPASCVSYLLTLMPTASNFRSHERLVIAAAQRRSVIRACREAEQRAYDLEDPDEVVAGCIRSLNDVRRHEGEDVVAYHSMIMRGFEAVERRCSAKGEIPGIPTGFAKLDRMLQGFQAQYYVLAGRPSMGKTALAMGMCRHAAQQGHKIGVLSLEMGEEQLALRELAGQSGIPLSRLREGGVRGSDWDRLTDAAGALAGLPISFAFSSFKTRQAERMIDDMVQRLGVKMIMIDYTQLMRVDGHKGNREQEVADISQMIKRKIKEHKIPILALAQLNRALESRPDKRPTLADLRESGALEQDADVIMFIYRDEVYNCKCPRDIDCSCGRRGKAQILVRKGRMEWTGDVDIAWETNTTTFRDVEARYDDR